MQNFFGYTRVSTVKQGEHGVSLQEQRDAITGFAGRNRLMVTAWFEEQETAAKRGRPVFNEMLKLLRQSKARGVIMHKIDRSARNLKDWAELGELIEHGIEVYFANEGLDLHTRGGRLSADIQAVVAADFIRNLREETRKGFYGRLKQGFYPMRAPVGYLDTGKAKAKEIDPTQGMLVRKAFELYATGRFNLETLGEELHNLGLRNTQGGTVTRTGLSVLLNNPFYIGLIRLKRTGEMFPGLHQPLIPKSLFDRVQAMLSGKFHARTQKYDFLFRRLLACKYCDYSLIGERQNGHNYYRCHTNGCATRCIREEAVEGSILESLAPLRFADEEKRRFPELIAGIREDLSARREGEMKLLTLRLAQSHDRMRRLTDAFLDGSLDQQAFQERKVSLLLERKDLEEKMAESNANTRPLVDRLHEFLELAGNAYYQYKMGLAEEKRELVRTVTSNRQVDGTKLCVTLAPPFCQVANRFENINGVPNRDIPRTIRQLLERLHKWFEAYSPSA